MLWTKALNVFYTYLYLREDGTPYYAGKGKGNRAFSAKHRLSVPPKDRILIQEFPSEADALLAEAFLIAYYGRKDQSTGCLWNLTDGGEGSSGWLMPKEIRRKITEANRGRKDSDETRRKKSEAAKGHKHSDESRFKMSNAKKGMKLRLGCRLSEEHKRKLSDIAKRRPEEVRLKNSTSHKGHVHSEETKRKISETLKRRAVTL